MNGKRGGELLGESGEEEGGGLTDEGKGVPGLKRDDGMSGGS